MTARPRTDDRHCEEDIMKRTLLAIALCSAVGYAGAQTEELPGVTVERGNAARLVVACTPPNDSPNCSYYHYLLRRNFTEHEIGMLFGAATSYEEYPTKFDTVRARYATFLRDIAENGVPVASSPQPVRVWYARGW